ncbi:MAG TPA: hypothetical protein VHE55_05385 [Fimbriimonadaceae bacterium]|nr:hypothetical protein [Fimbriimonadaceae bacterium]
MFRKLYWVTEQVLPNGNSSVTGIFTSIPNLIKEGFISNDPTHLRLTLTKLDCEHGALGTWIGPEFDGLSGRLQEFVQTEEFSAEQCEHLMATLAQHKAGV